MKSARCQVFIKKSLRTSKLFDFSWSWSRIRPEAQILAKTSVDSVFEILSNLFRFIRSGGSEKFLLNGFFKKKADDRSFYIHENFKKKWCSQKCFDAHEKR